MSGIWHDGGCDRMRSLVSIAVDGELEDELEPVLQAHLDACSGCRAWEAELRAIVRHLRAAERVAPQHAGAGERRA